MARVNRKAENAPHRAGESAETKTLSRSDKAKLAKQIKALLKEASVLVPFLREIGAINAYVWPLRGRNGQEEPPLLNGLKAFAGDRDGNQTSIMLSNVYGAGYDRTA